ncbi:MAG TPA: hypothetical protein VJJ23_05805 [Candidatus Nanoarchaeia archaeon]|nr:hypothetical protein [Candidatus Nanoarchaeia archaeon]
MADNLELQKEQIKRKYEYRNRIANKAWTAGLTLSGIVAASALTISVTNFYNHYDHRRDPSITKYRDMKKTLSSLETITITSLTKSSLPYQPAKIKNDLSIVFGGDNQLALIRAKDKIRTDIGKIEKEEPVRRYNESYNSGIKYLTWAGKAMSTMLLICLSYMFYDALNIINRRKELNRLETTSPDY